MSVIKARILSKVPVYLFNLRYLPTIVLLRIGIAEVLRSRVHFGLAADSYLMSGIINLLSQFVPCLRVMIFRFKAIKFLPPLCLCSCLWSLVLAEDATASVSGGNQVGEEHVCVWGAHVLGFIKNIGPWDLFVLCVIIENILLTIADRRLMLRSLHLCLKKISHLFAILLFQIMVLSIYLFVKLISLLN